MINVFNQFDNIIFNFKNNELKIESFIKNYTVKKLKKRKII